MPAARILCVDDDPGILLTLPQVLKIHGYEVTTAGSVPEALNIITSEQQFDVLISDLNMGHIADGFTVVHTMRKVNPRQSAFCATLPRHGMSLVPGSQVAPPNPLPLLCF